MILARTSKAGSAMPPGIMRRVSDAMKIEKAVYLLFSWGFSRHYATDILIRPAHPALKGRAKFTSALCAVQSRNYNF
jgi:hypothetical protein